MLEVEKTNTFHDPKDGAAPELQNANIHGTYLVGDEIARLSDEHRQYLLERHGTLELDPIPSMTDADPYNWPRWKVHNLLIDLDSCIA